MWAPGSEMKVVVVGLQGYHPALPAWLRSSSTIVLCITIVTHIPTPTVSCGDWYEGEVGTGGAWGGRGTEIISRITPKSNVDFS